MFCMTFDLFLGFFSYKSIVIVPFFSVFWLQLDRRIYKNWFFWFILNRGWPLQFTKKKKKKVDRFSDGLTSEIPKTLILLGSAFAFVCNFRNMSNTPSVGCLVLPSFCHIKALDYRTRLRFVGVLSTILIWASEQKTFL